VFGASNQLLAALTLLVVTLVLIRRNAKFWISLIPMVLMTAVCVWALVLLMRANIGKNVVLVGATGVLLIMALVLAAQAVAAIVRTRHTTKVGQES
jgi:carbon starvation protein